MKIKPLGKGEITLSFTDGVSRALVMHYMSFNATIIKRTSIFPNIGVGVSYFFSFNFYCILNKILCKGN